MSFEPGWLYRQFDYVNRDVATWPAWMRREAGITDAQVISGNVAEIPEEPKS